MLKELAILLFLITPVIAGSNETNESVPIDYIIRADLDDMVKELDAVRDDSASVRRMIEVNTRKLDELQARSWATSAEVENLSMLYNVSMLQTKEDILKGMDLTNQAIAFRMQTVKGEMYILVLVVLAFSVVLVNTVFGWKYKELVKHMGVFPKRSPMTQREKELDEKVARLEQHMQMDGLELERPKMSIGRLVLSAVVFLVILIFLGVGMYYLFSGLGVV